jgi:hypothetical protein
VIKFSVSTVIIVLLKKRWKSSIIFLIMILSLSSILISARYSFVSYLRIESNSRDVRSLNRDSMSKLEMRNRMTCFWRMISSIMSKLNDIMSMILNAWRIMYDLNVWLRNDWNAAKNFSLSISNYLCVRQCSLSRHDNACMTEKSSHLMTAWDELNELTDEIIWCYWSSSTSKMKWLNASQTHQ